LRHVPKDAKGRTDTTAYDAIINREARNFGLDPALVKAVIHRESYFNPSARSHAGAQGLMQLMPPTAKDMGVADPLDPEQNIRGGTRYLAMLVRRYHGDTTKALAAYNAGMKNVDDHNGIPPFKETKEYVEAVNKHYGSYRSKK
jgi:soluble lytic murein transglycosylase-like protein